MNLGTRSRKMWIIASILALGAVLVFLKNSLVPQSSRGSASVLPFSAKDLVNSADYSGGGVVPGEVVVLRPSNVGPREMVVWPPASRVKAALESGSALSSVHVFFDGVEASVIYSVDGLTEAIVPKEVEKRRTTAVSFEYEGARSRPVEFPVLPGAPAIYTLDATGRGQAAMLNETGCCNSVRNPATFGSVASLYVTGIGLPSLRRNIFGRRLAPREWLGVSVGNVPAEILDVTGEGLQINFLVPMNAPEGDAVPVTLTVGKAHSQTGVTMAIRSRRRGVLVVEKDSSMRSLIAATLNEAGYEVVATAGDEEAGELARKHPVDLLITDLKRPLTAGVTMIDGVRHEHPQVRIIAMMDAPDQTAVTDLRAADIIGANAVLDRPLKPALLLQETRDLLVERPARY